MRKVKILFFSADPIHDRKDGRELQLPEELRRIRKAVRLSRYGKRLDFETHGAARANDLIDLLADTDAEVVHFSGHGGPKGLGFASTNGLYRHRVDAPALKGLFQDHPGCVRLVVLASCTSVSQAQAIADVVGCAIGTIDNISDDAAIVFNSRFYQAIGNGHSAGRAFHEAKTALQVHNVPQNEHPRLFHAERVDPNALVLVKVRRWVRSRIVAAAISCAATAAAVIILDSLPVPPELTASDIACGAEAPTEGIRPLARTAATTESPSTAPGPAAALANAKALYRARNYPAAFAKFEEAAGGSGEAMGCLGYMHMAGRGVPPAYATGFGLIHEAAVEERSPHAMYALAVAYLTGDDEENRTRWAPYWFREAARHGFAEAMRSLGSLARQEENDSSYRAALEWYTNAVRAGSVDAWVDIGSMHEQGQGVPKDAAAALRHYHAAANARSARGMFAVGQCYEKAVGVARDYDEAMDWYRRAARAGSADAMNSIGVLYARGLGVRRSRGQAIRWYTRAAQAGSPLAKGNLAALGRG